MTWSTSIRMMHHIRKWLLIWVASICMTSLAYGDSPEVNTSVGSTTPQSVCNSKEVDKETALSVEDIQGVYRSSVVDLPAHVFPSYENRTGYNYLALTSLGGNLLRVRLATKEINGHDCGFDSVAYLCGRTIQLIPSDEDRTMLDLIKQSVPSLQVTANNIAFSAKPDGTAISGNPYCGVMGYLRHSFPRATRSQQIDEAQFSK